MNSTSLNQTESRIHEEAFLAETKRILLMQQELKEMEEQLDEIMESTHKREFQYGHVVEFEKLKSLKQISESIKPKRERLEASISNLYHSLFPGDIFLSQHFFETWVSIPPKWVIWFEYDLSRIELKMEVEFQVEG
jgi:hypothetical protein